MTDIYWMDLDELFPPGLPTAESVVRARRIERID
jgi:hypothetical protein